MGEVGLGVDDIDVYEINEAFASQAAYCVKKLGIPSSKVNPNGGAIALGHPLAMTGARQVATLFNQLDKVNKKLGVISMCSAPGWVPQPYLSVRRSAVWRHSAWGSGSYI